MNKKQRSILCLTAVALLVVLLFPPYVHRFRDGVYLGAGFHSLFVAPLYNGNYPAVVNSALLTIELLAVLVIGGLIFFLVGDNRL